MPKAFVQKNIVFYIYIVLFLLLCQICLRAFATVSRKKVLTYRICLNFQYLFIGINLKRKCEKNDRSPPSFFSENIREICQFFLKKWVIFQKYEVLKKTKKYIKNYIYNIIMLYLKIN